MKDPADLLRTPPVAFIPPVVTQFFNVFEAELNAGGAVTIVTGLFPGTLARTHVYVVEAVDNSSGVERVTLYNPWGFSQVLDLRDVLADTLACCTTTL